MEQLTPLDILYKYASEIHPKTEKFDEEIIILTSDAVKAMEEFASQYKAQPVVDKEDWEEKATEEIYKILVNSETYQFKRTTSILIQWIKENLSTQKEGEDKGLRWVKASERKPIGKNREGLNIKYKSKPDILIFLDGIWCWQGNSFEESKTFPVDDSLWYAIEWLEETPQPQMKDRQKTIYE